VLNGVGCDAAHEVHMYVYERKPTALMKAVQEKLEAAGYKVSPFYEERQFVDMDIVVSWGDPSEKDGTNK
jgi:hypothetical protein